MANFCNECGTAVTKTSRFCPKCGAAVPGSTAEEKHPAHKKRKPTAKNMIQQGSRVTKNIYLCEDGKYRWIYEMPILKNPTIFILVWKILFFIILGIFVFINILDAIEWGSDFAGRLPGNLLFFACFVAGMTVILVISMLIYAAIMGGKYVVMFEMDEKGVEHKQLPKQVKKAQAIALVTALAGIATHNVDRAKTRKIR